MTDPATEPVDETADELWADDALSDGALDRAAGPGVKLSGLPCGGGAWCRGGRS